MSASAETDRNEISEPFGRRGGLAGLCGRGTVGTGVSDVRDHHCTAMATYLFDVEVGLVDVLTTESVSGLERGR
mgnify:CR=1 FL=1